MASSSKMDLAFIVFFPECGHRRGYFGKAGGAFWGVVFPLGVHMSVHPISSSPDLHWAGREAVKAKGCEHRAVPVPKPELIPASLAGGLHKDTGSFVGDFRSLEAHPTPLHVARVLQKTLLRSCWEQKRETLCWNRHGVREQVREILYLPVSCRAGKSFVTFPKSTMPF